MINNPAEAAKKDKTSQIYRHIIELEMKPDVILLPCQMRCAYSPDFVSDMTH